MKPIINNETNILDNDYLLWIQDLCNRYRQSQIKASLQVNKGILSFYWELGKDIEERRYDNKYGSHFYEKLSQDLSKLLNNKKGLAPTSLRYTKYFYSLYSPLFENCRQLADEFDLLFYIIPLHRYCVVEIKVTEFDFQDIGQLAGYTAMVDDLLNTKLDNPSIGLLICKERNNVLAHYALSRINSPIGIAEFELSNQQLLEELKDGLPTIEEIERCIKS